MQALKNNGKRRSKRRRIKMSKFSRNDEEKIRTTRVNEKIMKENEVG